MQKRDAAKRNVDISGEKRIVGVAIRLLTSQKASDVTLSVPDVVVSLEKPYRHGHIIWALSSYGIKAEQMYDQGFITNEGKFLNRTEGAKFALSCGQIDRLTFPPELYSEDLW